MTPDEIKPLLLFSIFGIIFGLWIVTSWKAEYIDLLLCGFLVVYVFSNRSELQTQPSHQQHSLTTVTVENNSSSQQDHSSSTSVTSASNTPCSVSLQSTPHESIGVVVKHPSLPFDDSAPTPTPPPPPRKIIAIGA